MWSDIWFVATTRVSFWTWIWPTRHCRLRQEVACWFQCWKTLACFEGKSSFSSKLDCGSYIVSIAKTASKKIGTLICLMKFFLLKLLFISVNLPYGLVWNTVVMSRWVTEAVMLDFGSTLAASLQRLGHRRNVVSFSLFYRY